MLMQHARAATAYRQTGVQSSSPLELVVMLYDGLLRHLTAAQMAMQSGDLVARRTALSRSMAIISELQSTLNLKDGGEVGVSLDALYTYATGRLVDVNVKHDASALEEIERLFRPLRDAWAQVASGVAPPGQGR